MSINKTFILLIFVYITLFLSKTIFLGKTVYGDGIYYYSWVRSIVVDHDIQFANEYKQLGGTQPLTPYGEIGNVYPIGPPIFWSPFFITFHQIIHGDGYSLLYQIYIGIISCFTAITGLIILHRLLLKFFSERTALLVTLGIAFGTNLFFYGSLDTVNSHSVSFFISTILLTCVIEKRSFFIIGVFAGLLTLMRTQDAIFIFLSLPLLTHPKKFIALLLGFGLAFIPQLIAWKLLYGTVTSSPYLDAYHYFDFYHPHLINVLFSPNNGLFLWTPIIAVCTLGLILKKRYDFLLIILIQWFLISSWSFWWQGASFSGRMFISSLPLFAFGLGTILDRQFIWTRWSIVITFAFLNAFAILFYLHSH